MLSIVGLLLLLPLPATQERDRRVATPPRYSVWALPGVLISILSLTCSCERSHSGTDTSATAAAPASVQVVRPHQGGITRGITLPGEIKAYQQATLYAKVAGYLKSIAVDKGDAVKEGALLAELEVPELIADRAKFKAEVDVAAIDFQRVSDAQKKASDLVVPQTVDNARARLDIAKANLERNETLLGFARITAPFSGVVTRRLVDPGAFIPAATSGSAAQNAALITLMDFSKVRVQVAVPEPEVPFVKNGLPVKVSVDELPNRVFEGGVTRFAYALDDNTKTMLSEIEISNPKGELRPGMFATVKLVIEQKNDALLVPIEALLIEKAKSSVFTVAAGKAKKAAVKTGFNDGASVEILDGLGPNEPVILLGKQTLNDGQPVSVTEAK
jgi:membrane fusion protein, multidrug efflux system